MIINAKEIFNNEGYIKRQYMYAKMFNLMPSRYGCELNDTESEFDFEKIDKSFIRSIYPNAEVYMQSCRSIDDRVSCATLEREDNPDEPRYNRKSMFLLGDHVIALIAIILSDENIIITFDDDTVEVLYDLDSGIDIEKFTDDFISKLPTRKIVEDEYPKIELVAYDTDSGYYTIESEINSVNIDIDKNYNDDFKPVCEDIIKFIESEDRKSGLILLNGEPGTGKTYFIRHLITNTDKPYILIPPSMATSMSSPEFVTFLIEHKDSVFVLEDCETVIKERTINDFANAVSSLLNMSDGLMSDIFNGKFICTFNADIASVDEAILRKGRCFAKYEFGKLCADKAKVLLKERGFGDVDCENMSLADIYHYDSKGSGGKKTKKIGFKK